MFRLLVDTCVWLDLAKDPHEQTLLGVVEQLVEGQEVSLIVPRVVLTEFERNKARIVRDSCRSLASVFQRVRDAVAKFGDPKRKRPAIDLLNDVSHRIPQLGEKVADSVTRIEKLLTTATVIETTDEIKLRAAQRGIDQKAPFHRQRNGMADALLIETYADCLQRESAKGMRFAFVTHNVKDFSDPDGDDRMPHPEIAPLFSKVKSLYFTKLKDATRRIARPESLAGLMLEWDESPEEPRSLTEILSALDELVDKLWYDRHQLRRQMIQAGRIILVEKETYPRPRKGPDTIQRDIWEGALKSAHRVEKKYGKKNLGPYSKFEWGMLNGKISALRWVLGEDWDELYT